MIAKITRTGLTLGLFTALAVTGFAWQQTPSGDRQGGADVAPQQRGEGIGRRYHGKRGGRHHGARGIGRMLSRLNLNDAQREQVRAIMERNFQSTQPQRDELRQLTQQRRQQGTPLSPDAEARIQALHKSLAESMQLASQEALATLTPEQRAQLEQFKQERKERGTRGDKGMRGGMRGFARDLNLTEAQQTEMRAIRQRFAETIKPQREALRQLRDEQRNGGADIGQRAEAIRAQISQASKAMRDEMLNVLTPEQRTQIEQRQQERQNRREQFRQRRQIQ